MNKESTLDIIIANNGSNTFTVYLGDGKGGFKEAKGSPFPVGHYPSTVNAEDVNGDGIMDIALPAYKDNTVTIYFGGKSGIHEADGSPLCR